jgi:hypothetical protein
MVSNFEEEIYYYKDEPGKPLQGPLIEVHRESYQEAVRILEQRQLFPIESVPPAEVAFH